MEETAARGAKLTPADDALVHLLRERPEDAALELYDRFGRLVFSLALRMVGDRQIAEEITQDVFVECWRSAARFRHERGSLASWLLSITHHRAVDTLRSRRYQARRRETAWDEAVVQGLIMDEDVDLALVQAMVRGALADLPPAQREVIELLYFGGLTRNEVAERLQTPLGTIHTRLRLGFARLRGALADLGAELNGGRSEDGHGERGAGRKQ